MMWTPRGNLAVDLLDLLVHQQIRRVAGVMRHGFDLYKIAGLDPQRGRERGVEIAPVYGLGCGS
jgi:hypothetical protein